MLQADAFIKGFFFCIGLCFEKRGFKKVQNWISKIQKRAVSIYY